MNIMTREQLEDSVIAQGARIGALEKELNTVSFSAYTNETILMKMVTGLHTFFSDCDFDDTHDKEAFVEFIEELHEWRETALKKYADENNVPIYSPDEDE